MWAERQPDRHKQWRWFACCIWLGVGGLPPEYLRVFTSESVCLSSSGFFCWQEALAQQQAHHSQRFGEPSGQGAEVKCEGAKALRSSRCALEVGDSPWVRHSLCVALCLFGFWIRYGAMNETSLVSHHSSLAIGDRRYCMVHSPRLSDLTYQLPHSCSSTSLRWVMPRPLSRSLRRLRRQRGVLRKPKNPQWALLKEMKQMSEKARGGTDVFLPRLGVFIEGCMLRGVGWVKTGETSQTSIAFPWRSSELVC